MNDQQFEKDPIIFFDSYVAAKSKQGHDRHQMYLNKADATKLAEYILEVVARNKDLKIDMHMKERENTKTGHMFVKPFAFIKAKDGDLYEPRAPGDTSYVNTTSTSEAVVTDKEPSESLEDKIARLKGKEVKE